MSDPGKFLDCENSADWRDRLARFVACAGLFLAFAGAMAAWGPPAGAAVAGALAFLALKDY